MNSNYLLSMLGLVGNSLGLEQWLGLISSHCKDNFSVVMHWTVEGSTAKHCFCQISRVAVIGQMSSVSGWSMMMTNAAAGDAAISQVLSWLEMHLHLQIHIH